MSYYILPKTNNKINILFDLIQTDQEIDPFISHSLVNYIHENKSQLEKLLDIEEYDYLQKLVEAVNPYEYLFTKTPTYNLSVNKMRLHSNGFFEFIELAQTVNLFESFQNKPMYYGYFGQNSEFISDCMSFLRENKKDIVRNCRLPIYYMQGYEFYFSLDFAYYELDKNSYENVNDYALGFMHILNDICFFQKEKGVCVIKISDLYYKPILDAVFILSSFYEKCYIMKPNTTNVISSEKYLICKNFSYNVKQEFKHQIGEMMYKLIEVQQRNKNMEQQDNQTYVASLINNDISYYFFTKIEEANIILGQQQIDYYDKMINIMKNKNREDKFDSLRKINIQKCVLWCEKYKIPHNKLNDKNANSFLPLSNDDCMDDNDF